MLHMQEGTGRHRGGTNGIFEVALVLETCIMDDCHDCMLCGHVAVGPRWSKHNWLHHCSILRGWFHIPHVWIESNEGVSWGEYVFVYCFGVPRMLLSLHVSWIFHRLVGWIIFRWWCLAVGTPVKNDDKSVSAYGEDLWGTVNCLMAYSRLDIIIQAIGR